jgi:hypothetical protein
LKWGWRETFVSFGNADDGAEDCEEPFLYINLYEAIGLLLVKDVVHGEEVEVTKVRAAVLGLAADRGAANAEVLLADRSIILDRWTQ